MQTLLKIFFRTFFDNSIIRTFLTVFSITISSAAVAVIMMLFTLSVRAVDAPKFVKNYITEEIENLDFESQFEFGRVQIALSENFNPKIIVSDVTIYDNVDSLPFLEISKLELGASLRQISTGNFNLSTILLDGLTIGVSRDITGDYSIKFGQNSLLTSEVDVFSPASMGLRKFFEREAFLDLENFTVTSMTVQYDDQKESKLWVIDGARIELNKQLDDVFVRGDAAFLMGGADISMLQVNYETNLKSGDGSVGILFEGFPSKEIAAQAPALSWLNIVEAPISGAFRTKVGSEMEVDEINASLRIGSGVIRADDKSKPLRFDNANVYFSYNRKINLLNFEEITINSTDLQTILAGSVQLKVDENKRTYYTGTLTANELKANPLEIYERALEVEDVVIDFLLEPKPFNLEILKLSARDPLRELVIFAKGQIISGKGGWEVSSDLESSQATKDDIIAYWPPEYKKNGRIWLEKNVFGANLNDLYASVTFGSNIKPRVVMGYSFSNATINLMNGFPQLENAAGNYSFYDKRFSVSLTNGYVGDQAKRLDLSGSNLVVNNTDIKPYPAQINLNSVGPLSALISLSNLEKNNGFEVSKSIQGGAKLKGILNLPLKREIKPQEITYKLFGTIEDIKISEKTFPYDLEAARISLELNEGRLQLNGPILVGDIPVDLKYISGFGKEGLNIAPRIDGKILISEPILQNFGMGPGKEWFSGSSAAFFTLDLPRNKDATFRLTSNLKGLEIRIPELGWKKNETSLANLEVLGHISDRIKYDKLIISGEGLEVDLRINNNEKFIIERLVREDILDISGAISQNGLEITGGEVNIANYLKAIGSNGKSKFSTPIFVNLDRLDITDSFYIDNFSTSFVSDRIYGNFNGLFMGIDPVTGTFNSKLENSSTEILSNNAGAFLQAAGIIKKGAEGSLKLKIDRNNEKIEGRLLTEDLKIYDLPALAKLLQALSIIGLLEQMLGQGLFLTESDINFRLDDDQYIIDRASFFGPSLGISLDGYLDRDDRLLDFQGVFSPVYAINAIGSVLTRKGEGLIGFNFDLWGDPDSPKVLVNPFSVLTPGMFREIFRRPPPKVELDK